MPKGKLTGFFGDPGLGKSLTSLAITATVTRGAPWPDGSGFAQAGSVVIISIEDDPADTIRPRLDAAGADVAKVQILDGISWYDSDTRAPIARPFTLDRDVHALEDVVAKLGDCRLVIVDPLSAVFGDVDAHRNNEVRAVLAPLAAMAQRHRVAVLLVDHLTKGARGRAIYRAMGSIGIVAACRAAWCVVKNPNNPSRRMVLNLKNNLGPDDVGGLAYTVRSNETGVPCIAWEGAPVKTSADEVLAEEADDDRGLRLEAQQWLRDVLADGDCPMRDIEKAGKENGYSQKMLRKVKGDLGVIAYKEGFGRESKWMWKLPATIQEGTV